MSDDSSISLDGAQPPYSPDPIASSGRTEASAASRVSGSVLRFVPLFAFAVLFEWIALQRFVAQDEGFYTLATRLVSEGMLPYRDFFFPQMPLLPFVYAGAARIFGMTWETARTLSACFAILVALFLQLGVESRRGHIAGTAAVLFFGLSSFSFAWLTPVKTYALSTALLAGAWLAFEYATRSEGFRRWLLPGLLVGLAGCSRLYLVVLIPVFGLYLLRDTRSVKAACVFAFGIALGLLPAGILALGTWDIFWFNNLGYHLMRSALDAEEARTQKLVILRSILGLRSSQQFTGPLFPVLFWLTAAAAGVSLYRRSLPTLAASIGLVLVFVSLLPTPTYIQYACVAYPFLVAAGVDAGSELLGRFPRSAGAVVVAMLITSFATCFIEVESFTRSGAGVIGIDSAGAQVWTLPQVKRVSREIGRQIRPGQTVITSWPGYAYESDAPVAWGSENDFGWQIATKLSDEERSRYSIRSFRPLEFTADEQLDPPLLVFEDRFFSKKAAVLYTELGYRVVRRGAGAFILNKLPAR